MTESEKLKMNELADLAEELTAELQQMETTILTQKAKIQKQSSDNLKLQQTLQKASLQIQNQAEKNKIVERENRELERERLAVEESRRNDERSNENKRTDRQAKRR